MADFPIEQGPGLITNPGALNATGGGVGPFNPRSVGMRVADNVSLTRSAMLSPRPGFGRRNDITAFAVDAATPYRPVKIAPFDSDAIVQGNSGGTNFLFRASNATPYGAGTPQDIQQADVCFVESRESMYASTNDGVRKWTAPTDVSFEFAGSYNNFYLPLPQPVSVPAGQDDYAVSSTGAVAYRFVWVREDANGYIRRSAPSGRLVYRNTGGAANERINLDILPLPKQVGAGDRLEVYRSLEVSPALTATPSDELYLAITHIVTADDVTNKYIKYGVLVDDVNQANLGATLYTSPSQVGINKSNFTPPRAGAMAVFEECVWYANVTECASVSTQLTKVRYESGGQAIYDLDGLQVRHSINSANFTVGSATFTLAPADTAGLIPGMYVMDVDRITRRSPTQTGTYVPAETKLVSVNATTGVCVMDKVALASGNPIIGGTLEGVSFGDIVSVTHVGITTDFYASNLTTSVYSYLFNVVIPVYPPELRLFGVQGFAGGMSLTDPGRNSRAIAETIFWAMQAWFSYQTVNVGSSDVPPVILAAPTVLTLRALDAKDGAITVACNREQAFDTGATITSENNRHLNRVYYSRPSQPEAVPLLNFVDVGDPRFYIKALIPLRDGLLVFKDDGVFRITGLPPDGWRVDALERDIRLIHPECAAELDGRCFALTERGLAMFTEGGVAGFVSLPIAESLRFLLPTGYVGPARGFSVTAHPDLGLVLVQVHPSISSTGASPYFVYHVAQNAWTKWARNDRCIAYWPRGERFLVAPSYVNDVWQILEQRTAESAPSTYADQILTTITGSVASDVATVAKAAFDGNVPQVGDILSVPANGEFARITNVVDAAPNYVLTCEPGLSNGGPFTFTWYQGYQCSMQWQAVIAGSVSRGALWQEMQAELLGPMLNVSAASFPTFQLGGVNDQRAPEQTVDCLIKYLPTHSAPVRIGTPRAIARGAQFYPVVKVWTSGLLWGLGPLSLALRPTSTRVGRKAQM